MEEKDKKKKKDKQEELNKNANKEVEEKDDEGTKLARKIFANRFKEVIAEIEKKGISKQDIKFAIGLSQEGFARLYRGERILKPERMFKLKEKFGINLNYLFAKEEDKKKVAMFIDEDIINTKKYYAGDILKKIMEENKLNEKELFSKLSLIKTEKEFKEIIENKQCVSEVVLFEISAKFGIKFDDLLKKSKK